MCDGMFQTKGNLKHDSKINKSIFMKPTTPVKIVYYLYEQIPMNINEPNGSICR